MTHRALIVEDDPQIIHLIVDALASLAHEFDTACSQEEALKRMAEKHYSYILLDLQIPARAQNGVARIQNTENMLEAIGGTLGKDSPPIILMSDYGVNGAEETVEAMRLAISLVHKGARDIIAKPFPTAGRTLDRVIKKVLGIGNCRIGARPATSSARNASTASEPGKDVSDWLTVTEAAGLLIRDLPGLDLALARSRISTAAGRQEFKYTGVRKERRIEPDSFAAWRLKQRDRDLDQEDQES